MIKTLPLLILAAGCVFSCNDKTFKIDDSGNAFTQTGSPLAIRVKMNAQMKKAERENRLALQSSEMKSHFIPVQSGTADGQMICIITDGALQEYRLTEMDSPAVSIVSVRPDSSGGQYIFGEEGRPVLQYNYKTVYEKDVVRLEDKNSFHLEFSEVTGIYLEEYLKENQKAGRDSVITSSIYSVPRSDYIHPLYGLNGEMLTSDWPDGGHPHHRGIFWAWPEVELGSQRADLYALQRVFARPTGKVELTDGPVFAQLDAENLWMWEDVKPIVRENAVIRVYRATAGSRIIDIAVKLDALEDSITIATRGTNSYGSFNMRMQTPESQDISFFTDETGSVPLRSWADFSGLFRDNEESGLMVLQYKGNPEYPGPWQKYPELSWLQPVFPAHGTRYHLQIGEPLILRYRLIIHAGGEPGKEISRLRWDAFNSDLTPLYIFTN
jgi:hypothetical protein